MNINKLDTPIIKTFIANGNYYFYDTFANNVYSVTKEQYLEIKELEKIGITCYKKLKKNTQAYKDILMLLQKGLMKASIIKRIEHPATDIVDSLLYGCISDMTLQITRKCNFRCRYCLFANDSGIERHHEDSEMTFEIAKKSIDYLFEHSKSARDVSLAFYGGEPMLNFDLIKKSVIYADGIFFSKRITYNMTINGSIISDDMLDFLATYNVHLTISFDGSKSIQDKHRKFLDNGKGSFDVVSNNIKKIKEKYPDYFKTITFIAVVFDDEDTSQVMDYYDKKGIDHEKILVLDADLTGLDYRSKSIIHYSEQRTNYTADEKSYFNKATLPSVWHHNGPCIPSIKSLFVDIYGNFYPCEGFIDLKKLSIGNVNDGLDRDKVVSYMNIGELSKDDCKKCWLMRFCSICLLNCIDVDKKALTYEQKHISCIEHGDRVLAFLKNYVSQV